MTVQREERSEKAAGLSCRYHAGGDNLQEFTFHIGERSRQIYVSGGVQSNGFVVVTLKEGEAKCGTQPIASFAYKSRAQEGLPTNS